MSESQIIIHTVIIKGLRPLPPAPRRLSSWYWASRNHKEPNRSGSFEKHLAIMQMQCMHLLQRERVRLVRGSYRSPCSGSSFIHANRNREAITKTKEDERDTAQNVGHNKFCNYWNFFAHTLLASLLHYIYIQNPVKASELANFKRSGLQSFECYCVTNRCPTGSGQCLTLLSEPTRN